MKGVFGFLLVLILSAQTADPAGEISTIKAKPFSVWQVRLTDGPFREAMLRDMKYLMMLEPDRLLHTFRLTAGLPSSAKPYGGWEKPDIELRGHTLGHYLSACSLMYSSTAEQDLRTRVNGIVAELARIQQAMPSRGFHEGYLAAFPEEFFDRVDAGQKVWAPYYTLHKIMAGLLDAHQHCGNRQALEVLLKLADWVQFRVDRLTDEQQQRVLDTEFGGMMEVLENLYGVTGNANHLRLARKFDHRKVFDPLAQGKDPLNGLHANTQIPKAIGAARDYELTGDKRYHDIATFFWQRVAHFRSYVIGGNSDGELFFPPETFSRHLGTTTTETCNTYNMLKLTRHIFMWEPMAETMDFYERGLFNHILASQNPETGMMTYYVPLRPNAHKTFSTPEDSFWCCVGTGMENHAKYGDTIYFHSGDELYVNLFIASELDWVDKGVVISQDTKFPEFDTTQLTIKTQKPVRLALKIRYPSWARAGVHLYLNGKREPVTASPGAYITIDRKWNNGDKVLIGFPMSLHMETMPDDPSIVAFLYGPLVLAGDLGMEGLEAEKRYGLMAPQMEKTSSIEIPVFRCDAKQVLTRLLREPGTRMTFRTAGSGIPGNLLLKPFYQVVESRYTIYWKLHPPEE
ncbi:MAG: glycoside hydrolase family 127 protein [Acidobacteria bacterium]|nr:glycoside hydrolase family 127 protein [Acidobacteriota bacterium]